MRDIHSLIIDSKHYDTDNCNGEAIDEKRYKLLNMNETTIEGNDLNLNQFGNTSINSSTHVKYIKTHECLEIIKRQVVRAVSMLLSRTE